MFKEKALAAAVIISAVWHLFWLSAITVVSSPGAGPRTKFSKVSFLGPILETATAQVQAAPSERSLLEKRYFDGVVRAAHRPVVPPEEKSRPEEALQADFYILKDGKLSELIRSAVGESRVEPPF